MALIFNILWLIFGGFAAAVAWFLVALLFCVSIIGLPWARAAFNIALFTLLPFGQVAVRRDSLTGREDLGTGALGALGNIIWLIFGGFWLAIGHLVLAFGLACSIIGIPFAWQHLKLAQLALWPIGMVVVPSEVARYSRRASLFR
jgi:uncharacterized membrane protein YccF (DUF307 family)